ncbi:hypothetical protein C0991_002113 [Blastosporella zonata]|nr:hypothetical protein C0991_002113 [Blastosporella zonata]
MDVPTLFALNLQTFSNNVITDLQYFGLTRDEPLSREALQVAAGLFKMWDQRPERLQDKEWAEETAVMEAGQDLWTMWSLREWAQEMPYYKFFSMTPKAMVPGQRSVALANINMTNMQEMPLFEEDNKDFDLVDEGLEGEIAVWVQWSTRAIVMLAPHSERLEFWAAEGPCQQCTTAKVAKHCWYLQARLLCCHCLNIGIACKNSVGDTAHNAQGWACIVRRKGKKAAAPAGQAVRALVDDKEGPMAGPSNTTLAALPTLGMEDDEEEVLGVEILAEGILGEPKLEARDDGTPVAPEGSEGSRVSESAKLVWRLTDKPATKFKRVTRRVGEMREMEAAMANYATACEQECVNLRLELLCMQTVLGETRQL